MKQSLWVYLALGLFLFCRPSSIESEKTIMTDLYVSLEPVKYLTGSYKPNSTLVEIKDPQSDKVHFLRLEAQKYFLEMVEAYEQEKPKGNHQKIFLVSTFRSFSDQKSIWEGKFTGKKVMREPIAGKSPKQIIDLILEFSSAPGTSRHHWGTDFDINSLENPYFEGKGRGNDLYLWLKSNAGRFGYCQPYNELSKRGNKGYHEEKWHWSFAPIAVPLQEAWIKNFNEKKITLTEKFLGADTLGETALDYVASTNLECREIAKRFSLQSFSQE